MFPIDALHRFFRHSVKGHARETIAFGRRNEAQLERAHLFAIFRNLVKRRSERRPRSITPAMWIGIADARWTWEKVFAQRLHVVAGLKQAGGQRTAQKITAEIAGA